MVYVGGAGAGLIEGMNVAYGFNATMTAKPGMGDQLVEMLLTGLRPGNPAASEYCLVYLVSRSASDQDVVHITEGWTTAEDHDRIFAGPEAKALVEQLGSLIAGESTYTDYVPVNGKAQF